MREQSDDRFAAAGGSDDYNVSFEARYVYGLEL
jgi:hypothetical protein